MANRDNYLFALSFIAKDESGLALVSAPNATTAFQILKNSGRYNYGPEFYILLRSRNLGLYTCRCAELLLESYTNAEVAYEKFVSIADSFVGPAGEPAGFGSVVATVDDSTGVPYVEVSVTGPDTAKNFDFSFHNLKGQDGSDAEVTAQNIQSALGYVPVAPADISQFITKTVDDLTNYYLKSETYTKAEIAQILSVITTGFWQSVSSLPAASADTFGFKIYLVPSPDPKVQNQKDEYITVRNGSEGNYTYAWEQIGSTAIDLSDYVTTNDLQSALSDYITTSDLSTALSGKQDTLVSGTNIKTINNQSILGSGNIEIQGGSDDAVLYTPQSLTEAQKEQARTNIGAGTSSFSIDSSMSSTSENPVQNKVIYAQLQTKVGSETVDNIVELTKAQYDALATKDPGTLYIITDAGEADGYVSITGFEQTQSSSVSGGSNVWTVYLSNGQSFSLTVKNGEQGNTGSSVAYPYELINNLTTDDATKGLSAAQGKVLDGKVSQLEAEVDDLFADSPADLDLADEDGNVVARFEGGNIKVKNFDSSETTKTANGAAGDLDICDESGNIVARFKDGNIKTKNFDSSRFQQTDDICDFIENSFHTGRFKFDRVTIWDYYAAYDELCDFRQILVKESPIGFSTLPSEDRATKDPNQYPINLYRIPNTSARKRIVFMGAIHGDSQFTDANPTGEDWYGDHGDAQENILAPYYFVCDLIRHKDDNPEYKLLLQEYEIDIIPILNPWGVQNHSRRNGNNVDLNRNFDATDSQGNSRWQNQTQGNKGASPFSENETQAIVSYINAHNDIHLVVECHARGEVNLGGDNRFYAVCPDGVPIQQGITDAVNAAKAKFGAQGGLHPYTRDEVPATCYAWIFFEKGIPTFEPELGQSIGRRFFFNVKMSTAKRLNINDVYTITTTVPDFVVTFRVVASDGSDEAMVLGDTYALLYNGTYICGNDTITIASNTVMDAPSRHCKELLYSMFWYYRKLVFNTL